MADRIAPEGGYNFANKVKYRARIWEIFKQLKGQDRYTSNCMLMPSSEGIEIDVAHKAGFRIDRMHVVDRNPAIVAHLKRRWPTVTTYGVEIERAAERALKSGTHIDVAHLDLCGNVNKNTTRILFEFVGTLDPLRSSFIAVNVLRGRESSTAQDMMKNYHERIDLEDALSQKRFAKLFEGTIEALSERDRLRLYTIWTSLTIPDEETGIRFLAFPLAVGSYGSSAGTQTMFWSVFHLVSLRASFHEVNNRRFRRAVRRIAFESISEQ